MAKRATCNKCQRPQKACYCHTISKIETDSKILIIRHFKEKDHPFNTARMAEMVIDNCSIVDSDNDNAQNFIEEFIHTYKPFLLFYNESSQPISSLNKLEDNSKNFILLDGTWSKARSLLYKYPALADLNVFYIETNEATIYKSIRKACAENFVSTIEATKIALENLWPNKEFSQILEPLKFTIGFQQKESTKK